jgi:hypothetical protein
MSGFGQIVMFKGIPAALQAYTNMDIPAWSLWCGSQLNFSYNGTSMADGAGQLQQYLEMIDQDSKATFSLKLHNELKKGEKITGKTPYHASFSFKLQDQAYPSDRALMYGRAQQDEITQLKNQMAILTERLAERDQEEEPADQGGIGGVLNGILAMPEIQQAIAARIIGLVDKFLPPATDPQPPPHLPEPDAYPMRPAKISGVPREVMAADQVEQINRALQILARYDDHLGDHLEKLADIAQRSPTKFKMLLNLLKMQ